MNQPRQPVTLLPEQVEALSRKLAEMRHNINNDLALINAVVEVVTRKPDMAGRLMVSLSEQPVKIVEEMKRFSQSKGFLNLLVCASPQVPVEELVSATLREMSRVQDDPRSFLVTAGKELTGLLNGEYSRLKAILERLRP